MSHDRGCSCGKEKYEYHECTVFGCPNRPKPTQDEDPNAITIDNTVNGKVLPGFNRETHVFVAIVNSEGRKEALIPWGNWIYDFDTSELFFGDSLTPGGLPNLYFGGPIVVATSQGITLMSPIVPDTTASRTTLMRGEVVYSWDTDTLRVGDGSFKGGHVVRKGIKK
jgi:hypothetical protein